MAATLTLTAATPYALKYHYAYDGAGGAGSGTANRTQAQMLADLASVGGGPSPLLALLSSITVDADWDALAGGDKLSVYMTMRSQLRLFFADLATAGGTRMLQCVATDGQITAADVEVRFHHSMDR